MITLLLVVALVGFLVWALVTYIPMPEPFKKGLVVLAVVLLVLYILRVFGIADIPIR